MMRARATYEIEDASSSRKRQRLSSPTYDEQYELSQDQISAFDAFDRELSQRGSSSPPKPSQAITRDARRRRSALIANALKENISKDIPDVVPPIEPCGDTVSPTGVKSAAALPPEIEDDLPRHSGFSTASSLKPASMCEPVRDNDPPSSPFAPTENDMSWFEPGEHPTSITGFASAKSFAYTDEDDWLTAPAPAGASGFMSAKSINAPKDTAAYTLSGDSPVKPTDEVVPTHMGFTTGSSLLKPGNAKAIPLQPSAEALAKAAATMKKWQREMEDEFPEEAKADLDSDEDLPLQALPSFKPVPRPVLEAVENSFTDRQPPSTPSPAGRGVMSLSPLAHRTKPSKPTFKPPSLLSAAALAMPSTSYVASPLNPNQPKDFAKPTPVRRSPPATPVKQVAMSPPRKSLGLTPRRVGGGGASSKKPAFATPFKQGMRPGEPGRLKLDAARPAESSTSTVPTGAARMPSTPAPTSSGKGKGRVTYFDLTKPKGRQSLATCGSRPQTYTEEELETIGINFTELRQITPETALYYCFHSAAPTPLEPPPTPCVLGVDAALDELRDMGCTLATKTWVENHWSMILWKLAGIICLDLGSEANPATKRWCWREVMRQLRYRYERELNSGSRPALRLIAAQDVSPTLPMVLCVSRISWSSGGVDEKGVPHESVPELELTDGWYRMHAEVDEPIVRALRKSKIAVGMKIAISGARLSSERKEATEILEGGSSIALKINGNSSHLAPWHAKLGFHLQPFTATLGSLTADGGPVAPLDLTILKVYPIAFFEFVETDGDRRREGPRNEREEAVAHEKWLAQRDTMATKMRGDADAKLHALEGYADRLERKAGGGFRPSVDDSAPDGIDDLLLELEEEPDPGAVIRRVTQNEAGWLARELRDKCRRDRDSLGEDIARELNSECPPREVRSFRVLVVRDAQTHKRPPERCAQVTVWDVLSAFVSEEGKAGSFKEGQRFIVTNLVPTQQSAWMPRGEDSVVYLSTRKDSCWQKLKN